MIGLVIVCELSAVPEVRAIADAWGHSGGYIAVPLSADGVSITHYGGHSFETAEKLAELAAAELPMMSDPRVFWRRFDGGMPRENFAECMAELELQYPPQEPGSI